ncbi:hypothetical protein [Larkinella humicola]|uniref:Uncharacterized protein n=1 Tax=Larkinella humicola TaxID=2607654 RepID=A0A5N1JJR9_9BACT|nr:hypothetical protein [Larkinella humicola]KAA9354931.1 hypothetical protein F0P93_10105 [Larkinella humicola]
MMVDTENTEKKSSKLVNWGTVWGMIFATIALDVYLNYRENTQDKEIYRTKYEVKASEADSLRAVKVELEKRLLELNQRETTAVDVSSTN